MTAHPRTQHDVLKEFLMTSISYGALKTLTESMLEFIILRINHKDKGIWISNN